MEPYKKFSNPAILKSNLILSSLYLSAYEILKSSIVDNIISFFSDDFEDGKPIPDDQYKEEVSKTDKDLLRASCLWLKKMGVITQEEVDQVQRIREHRNLIAHELPKVLLHPGVEIKLEYLLQIWDLVKKIELWWVKEVHMPTDPDFDGVEVKDEDIYPGAFIILSHLIQIVMSDYLPLQNQG